MMNATNQMIAVIIVNLSQFRESLAISEICSSAIRINRHKNYDDKTSIVKVWFLIQFLVINKTNLKATQINDSNIILKLKTSSFKNAFKLNEIMTKLFNQNFFNIHFKVESVQLEFEKAYMQNIQFMASRK